MNETPWAVQPRAAHSRGQRLAVGSAAEIFASCRVTRWQDVPFKSP